MGDTCQDPNIESDDEEGQDSLEMSNEVQKSQDRSPQIIQGNLNHNIGLDVSI